MLVADRESSAAIESCFLSFPDWPLPEGTSETSAVKALNAEPADLARGDPSGSTAWVKTVTSDSQKQIR